MSNSKFLALLVAAGMGPFSAVAEDVKTTPAAAKPLAFRATVTVRGTDQVPLSHTSLIDVGKKWEEGVLASPTITGEEKGTVTLRATKASSTPTPLMKSGEKWMAQLEKSMPRVIAGAGMNAESEAMSLFKPNRGRLLQTPK